MEIVLYDASWSSQIPAPQAEVVAVALPTPTLTKTKISVSKLSRQLGYNLLIVALAASLYVASPYILKEAKFRLGPKQEEITVSANFGQIIKNEEITAQKLASQEAQQYGIDANFSIVIPKINAKAQIVPNVDPGNKEEYTDALKQGVAHAYGTSFPGNKGTIFLFSHSTNADYNIERFNAIFYLLKELVPNDKIIIFYAGLKHEYLVAETQTVEAEDISWLTSNTDEDPSTGSGQERLILQTCWPPGTSLKRLVVIAKPI